MKLWVQHNLKSGVMISMVDEQQLGMTNVLADIQTETIWKQSRKIGE